MSILTTKTARTMMYVCSIGGLLVVNGAAVTYLWNTMMESRAGAESLRFLEGVGITAFAYVIIFAVKFGRGARPLPIRGEQVADTSVKTRCDNMTPKQRQELRNQLVQQCGCTERDTKERTFVHEHHN
ncbi:MAG: hypothetical protein FGM32_00020 [Candidatus Kapabacteria bacterium]|nr:hypothetical protein [Candidatus Kapabacteria bacterium]